MPIYEYRCQDCGKVSEFQMKISDPHPAACPTCGQPNLTKIMSLPAFQLKGGGWYADAYDGKSNKKTESKTETKEAAPAATSDSKPSSSSSDS